MRVTSVEHDGTTYHVDLHEASGSFSTVIDGESYKADTLIKLREKIARINRRKSIKLALPATVAKARRRFDEGPRILLDVVITGIHARHRDVLYRTVPDKKAGTVENGDRLLKRLTEAERAEYLQLQQAKFAAIKAYERFEETHTYERHAVEVALHKAEKAAGIDTREQD